MRWERVEDGWSWLRDEGALSSSSAADRCGSETELEGGFLREAKFEHVVGKRRRREVTTLVQVAPRGEPVDVC